MGNGPGSQFSIKPQPFDAQEKIKIFYYLRFFLEICYPGQIPRQSHELFEAALKNLIFYGY